MRHNYIGTEHLLLGLVREGDGVAMTILRDFGVEAEQVRDEVVALLSGMSGGTITAYPRELPKGPRGRRRHWSPVALVAVTWALGAVTLGAGILIGWATWG